MRSSPPSAPVRGVAPLPLPVPPQRFRPRTSLAAVALVAIIALAAWAVVGWNVLPRPYDSRQPDRAACAVTASSACTEPVESSP